MTLQVQSPFQQFFDLSGDPLDNGFIYIGQANLNPQQYPSQVYWDQAGTIPALQPIRTLNGYAVRNGTPARIFINDADYSIMVKDKNGRTVFVALSVTAVSYSQLAGSNGASFVGFIQAESGAVQTTVQSKLREQLSVKDFGAIGDGVANDTAAVQAMITSVGYATFTKGSYLLSSATFDAPLNFGVAASLSLPLGQTLTITGVIDSPKQYIFQGAGSYLLRNDLDSGENSQQVHVSWFGAFPTVRTETDQAPFIAKCFASLDNTREAEVYFDKGRYHIGAALTVPRATAVIGEGSRRTVFDIMSDGFDVFTTQANGCRFQGFQFEVSLNIVSGYRASGAYIKITQQLCDVYDVWLGQATQSIVITAAQCRLFNIASTYSQSVGAGSSLVSVQASDVNIEQVLASNSAFGPDAIIEVGGASAANITGVTVENVNWGSPSSGVLVSTSVRILTNITIQDLRFRGSVGAPATELVKLITTGTGTLTDVIIDGVSGNANSTNAITIAQGSSVSMSRVSITNVKSAGTAGYGVSLVRTAGTLSRVVISDTVSVPLYATPFVQTGTMSEVSISPIATPGANAAFLSEQTLADDAFFSINLNRAVFTGMLAVTVGSTQFGVFIVRTSPAETITAMFAPSANMNSQTGVLNGTTGVDGKFTVSVSNNVLYFENRLGFSQPVNVVQLFGTR
jgi:hypothetical protein